MVQGSGYTSIRAALCRGLLFVVWPAAHIVGSRTGAMSTMRVWTLAVPIVITVLVGLDLLVYFVTRLRRGSVGRLRECVIRSMSLSLLMLGPSIVNIVEMIPVDKVRDALVSYRVVHGRLPDRLELLTPRFIGGIPNGRVMLFGCKIGYRLVTEHVAELWVHDPSGLDHCTSLVLRGPRRRLVE